VLAGRLRQIQQNPKVWSKITLCEPKAKLKLAQRIFHIPWLLYMCLGLFVIQGIIYRLILQHVHCALADTLVLGGRLSWMEITLRVLRRVQLGIRRPLGRYRAQQTQLL
jgi:hypothetical protein